MHKLAFNLSLILVFTIPWEDSITIGGISSLTRYVGILVSVVWLISLLATRKIRKPVLFHLVFFLFIIWNALSLFWTADFNVSRVEINTYVQMFVLCLLIWDLYVSKDELNKGLQAFILGCYVLIITTLIDFVMGREIGAYSGGRYAGVGNAVDLALVLTLGLPIAWHLATSHNRHKRVITLLNFGYLPVGLFTIILTGTRMAIIAVIPALIYIISTLSRLRLYVRVSSFFALIAAMFWIEPLIPRSTLERLGSTISSITVGDLGGRMEIWRRSISYWVEHPIIGIGSGALRSPLFLNSVAHNTFLSVLTEVGMIGFLLFITIMLVVAQRALRQNKEYSMLWVTVLAVWALGVFTLTWEFKKTTWLLLTFIITASYTNYLSTYAEKTKARLQRNT